MKLYGVLILFSAFLISCGGTENKKTSEAATAPKVKKTCDDLLAVEDKKTARINLEVENKELEIVISCSSYGGGLFPFKVNLISEKEQLCIDKGEGITFHFLTGGETKLLNASDNNCQGHFMHVIEMQKDSSFFEKMAVNTINAIEIQGREFDIKTIDANELRQALECLYRTSLEG